MRPFVSRLLAGSGQDRALPPYLFVTGIYAGVAGTYIFGSGLLVGSLLGYSREIFWTETLKGLAFVLITSLTLALVLRKAERAYRFSRMSFRSLVENLPDAVLVLKVPEREILYVNPAATRLFGYSDDELVGQSTSVLHVCGDDFRRFAAITEDVLAVTDTFDGEFRMRHKDGRIFPSRHMVTRYADDNGEQYAVSLIRDETESRFRQAELLQAQKMQAVGQLTGGIAHDFNNVLTVILGNAEELADRLHRVGVDAPEPAEIIHSCERAIGMTRRLLDFSRRQSPVRDRVDLNDTLRQTSRLMQRTIARGISIELDLADDLWPIVVDASALETCLLNLALNARDAMPHGGSLQFATVNDASGAEPCAPKANGECVVLTVADTGCGIPADIRAHVFDPFFTTKDPGKGTGLGLSMVHGFVKQAGGSIAVDSEPGQGTRFEIRFPRAAA